MDRLRVSAGVICLALLAGCSTEKSDKVTIYPAQVRGSVMLDGRSLTHGTVTFYPQDNRADRPGPGIASIDPQGNYWVGNSNLSKPAGLPPGRYKVTVLVMTPRPEGAHGPIAILAVPEAYTKEATTPFEYEIVAGENKIRLDLKTPKEPEAKDPN